jgi:hypothetical protein
MADNEDFSKLKKLVNKPEQPPMSIEDATREYSYNHPAGTSPEEDAIEESMSPLDLVPWTGVAGAVGSGAAKLGSRLLGRGAAKAAAEGAMKSGSGFGKALVGMADDVAAPIVSAARNALKSESAPALPDASGAATAEMPFEFPGLKSVFSKGIPASAAAASTDPVPLGLDELKKQQEQKNRELDKQEALKKARIEASKKAIQDYRDGKTRRN